MATRPSKIALVLPLAFAGVAVPVSSAHAAAPANDLFADTIAITPGYEEVVDTTEATGGEDEDLAAQAACNSPDPEATVWCSLTVESTQWVILSSVPPTYSSGFNVLVDVGEGFECVVGGPVEVFFIAEPGLTYYIQSIDDQLDGGGNGGILDFSATSGGAPQPEICPGVIPNDPGIHQGLNLIVGTDDHDHLRGTRGDDLIIGRGGDDDIDGGKGNDEVRGGPGNDHIHGGSGDDGLFGNQGDDDMSSNRGNDFMSGGFGNDHVEGNAGDDSVAGGRGDDEVNGNGGDDFITGDLPNGQEDTNPNHDQCHGGRGTNEIIFCEED